MDSNEDMLGMRDRAPLCPEKAKSRAIYQKPKQAASTPKRKRIVEPLTAEERERRKKLKEEEARKAAKEKPQLVVSIDFGTTNSGTAFASTIQGAEHVEVINKWNGGANAVLEKVPTCYAYSSENSFSNDTWGYDVPPGSMACIWFKLELGGETSKSDFDDPLLERSAGSSLMHLPEGKTAQEVTTDYLRHFHDHILERLREMIGPTAVNRTMIRFMLTVPATWPFAARQATRTAALNAGISQRKEDTLVLIDEPEAAAIAAIKDTTTTFGASPFKVKTSTMIIDIGGGTADLVTYRIIRLDPLALEEACVGQGGKCGGTTVDRNFHKILQERFGIAFEELPLNKIGARSHFMNAFEAIKRDFRGNLDESKVYEVPLKMKKLDEEDPKMRDWYDFEEDVVKLTGADLEAMFEPVLQLTFQLVSEQLKGVKEAKMPAVQTLVLCGGMGASPYVRARFEVFSKESLGNKVTVVSPNKAWSAIARGAVMGGLEKSPILYRRCRDHIGFPAHVEFVKGKHKSTDLYMCPVRGPRAKNQMQWHVHRGEKISANLKRPIGCYVTVKGTEKSKDEYIVYQNFYAFSGNEAPERVDHEGVFHVGSIKIDMFKAVQPMRKVQKKKTGRYPKALHFDIVLEMTLGADKGVLEITGKYGRIKLGSASIEYVADPAYKGVLVSDEN